MRTIPLLDMECGWLHPGMSHLWHRYLSPSKESQRVGLTAPGVSSSLSEVRGGGALQGG